MKSYFRMVYKFDVSPIPKPRMVSSDKWKKRPIVTKYFGYKDELRLNANIAGLKHLTGKLELNFIIAMPRGWSKKEKEKMDRKPHQPENGKDIDNLAKGILDIFETNDSFIYDLHSTKHWGYKPQITIITHDID
jgi:Holliday junction resolvase RusA-like endonuclease